MPTQQPPGTYTRREIQSQPDVWASSLISLQQHATQVANLFRQGNYDAVIFTGCGSPYYLGIAAATLLQAKIGAASRAVPASELWFAPDSYLQKNKKYLLVAVSRSGETTEVIRACEQFMRNKQGDLLTIVCNPTSTLASLGRLNLTLPDAMEESVAQTRAFSTLYLASAALPVMLSEQTSGQTDTLQAFFKLPRLGRTILAQSAELAFNLGCNLALDRFYFLGSGTRYGLACELSLKMKEMTLSHSEPFHFMEFRHGPMSMIAPTSLVVALVSQSNREREMAVVDEMRAMGSQIVTLGESGCDVNFASGLDEDLSNVLYLPFGQMMALERALAKGLNPDRPDNLVAFVTLK